MNSSKTVDSKKTESMRGLLLLSLLTALSAEFIFQHFIDNSSLAIMFGRVIIVFLTLVITQNYATKSMLRYKPDLKELVLLHSILIGSIFILWFGKILTVALSDYLTQFDSFKSLSPQALHFAIPFACGGVLISAVRGLNFGLVLSICFAILVGFYLPSDILIIPYVLVTTLIACLSLEDLRSRVSYLKAALEIGVIAIPFSLIALVFAENVSGIDVVFRVLMPLVGGLLAVAIAASITPLLEYLGGYVTDLRLIEMSTLDHPLLKELSIQAPGTWNHSMVLGMMVEAAADEVDANTVLSRVGAYFHDIGKAKKPLYFVENQKNGENRHDRLSPSMSALIIRSHVKDGVEMAREHRIPEAIIDLIQQHHGTSTIEYFYKKACKDAEESEETVEVDKSLYTYPGPKPQTREAGILMLADVIESSSRTLPDLSLDRIQKHIQTMINRIFASGQLDECDLTLRDLHKIARCFTRVLNGIHHQRIAYDEPEEKKSEKAEEKRPSTGVARKSSGEKSKNKSSSKKDKQKKVDSVREEKSSDNKNGQQKAKEDNSEDLKRLGVE